MKKWMVTTAQLLISTATFAGGMGSANSDLIRDGLFLGIGSNYNSIDTTQNSWGKGISNILTNTGDNSNGVAQGTGAPFNNTINRFAPQVQAGYFKHVADTQHVYGLKFAYQYLGSTATNSNLYIPQLGQMTSNTGTTSSLFGYVNADSMQVTTSHELTLMALIGRSFGNKYFYLGAGPSLFNLKSKNYYSIGYAEYNGATVNVTGLVSYSSPSIWAVGGAAQFGMAYFISPSWFIDASYTYARTGNNTTTHDQTFSNSSALGSVRYTTSGTLFTKDTLKTSNQAVTLSMNKVFDV